ncbi:MAG TPA: hypothetical protein VN549_07325 [Negativicutes bacterium]|nr:hypothetical protein [Negativicutes bacterium]
MLRDQLKIDAAFVEQLNQYFMSPQNTFINDLMSVVEKYGTPEEINEQARQARQMSSLMDRLKKQDSPYIKDLEWLTEMRDKGAFTTVSDYRRNILGPKADCMNFDEGKAVTLEVSALQYFPWLIAEAKQAIDKKEIMPGRFIRVRKMKEQEGDNGDILAVAAAMQIVGASYVETLETKGTDGSNIHLGGPATITGYFGGIGQPNDHALMFIDELLYYYTNYGINEVLNINPGTVFLCYMLYKLGVNIRFKISVFMGNDNPYSVLWTLMMARLFAREDGTTPLIGFNLSNSVNNKTIAISSEIRRMLGLENNVRIEHHITETYRSIVQQPYNRRDELMDLASTIPNISAKHEGGDPDEEVTQAHTSDILDYFRTKDEIISSGDMDNLLGNYICKHNAVNNTARALTENGLSFIGAKKLHRR